MLISNKFMSKMYILCFVLFSTCTSVASGASTSPTTTEEVRPTTTKTSATMNATTVSESTLSLETMESTPAAEKSTPSPDNQTTATENQISAAESLTTSMTGNKTALAENQTSAAENSATSAPGYTTSATEDQTSTVSNQTSAALERTTTSTGNLTSMADNQTSVSKNNTPVAENQISVATNTTLVTENLTPPVSNLTTSTEKTITATDSLTTKVDELTYVEEDATNATGKSSTLVPVDTSLGTTEASLSTTTSPPNSDFTTMIPSTVDTADYRGEFEYALSDEQMKTFMIFRSEASENRTLHLTERSKDAVFVARLCVIPVEGDNITVQVVNIVYSNDGSADNISLSVNDQPIGNIITEEAWEGGLAWNIFKDTGPIGDAFQLPSGNHSLYIKVIDTDKWGVEFDYMDIRALNQDYDVNLLCTAEFIEDEYYFS